LIICGRGGAAQGKNRHGAAPARGKIRSPLTLSLPRFTHTGKVTDLQFHADDQTWSENLKRSMINLLQVKGQPEPAYGPQGERVALEQEDQSVERSSGERKQKKKGDKWASGAAAKSFNRMETTIEGECDMSYTVVENEGGRRVSSPR